MSFRIADHRLDHPTPADGRAGVPAFGSPDDSGMSGIPGVLGKVRGVVLLAGSVRANQLRKAVGRFHLELPVDAERCVMDIWHEQLTQTAAYFGLSQLKVRVIVDRASPMPASNEWNGRCDIRFEQDPFDFRGTGGLLRDLSTQYGPDDYLLIANASQLLFDPLHELAEQLADLHADVALACRADGSPTGIMLVRCGALASIPELGFIDLNEQALPAIAKEHDVRVLRTPRQYGVSIRALPEYLEALRQYHQHVAGRSVSSNPFHEDWRATFGIIEPGARVDPSAVVHDSVVLSGGKVEAGALLVRAVVCPGGTVHEGTAAVDCLVAGPNALNGRDPD